MNEAQLFSVHVVSTTPLRYRPDFLGSLAEQREKRFQVVHVDGVEQEGDVGRGSSIDVIHVRNFREANYAKGHNQAIALALQRWPQDVWSERFLVLARPETVFHPACLEVFVKAFQEDPALMLAGPKMLLAEALPTTDHELLEVQMTRAIYEVGYLCRKDRHLRFLLAGEEDASPQASQEVFGSSEPCLVIRASALHVLREGIDHWLDESLPRGQELIDVCWRAHQYGLMVKVLPEACVWFTPTEPRESVSVRRHFYLAGPVREKNDWISLELLHFPWIISSMFRSTLYLLMHPRACALRLRAWYAWHRYPRPAPVQKEPKRVSVADMRRWFV